MTAKRWTPHTYQQALALFASDHQRCNLWAGMGTGKTPTTASVLRGLSLVGDPFPTLVLAPLRVANSTWPNEFAKWDHLTDISIRSAAGGTTPMRDALRQLADVTTINYDNVVDLVEHYGSAWPFRTVIADESTRLKSFRTRQGGKRAQALGRIAHTKVERWINLTGTPAPNGLIDAWGQQWFIDAGERLGRTFSAFEGRFFAYRRKKDAFTGKLGLVMEMREFAEHQIHALLADCTMTIRAGDYLDLPPLIENVIEVELPPRAMRHYRELERDLFTKLADGTEVEAMSAAAKSQKCLQAAAGALYKDPDVEDDNHPRAREWVEIHDAKIDALRSVVEEAAGAPVLCSYLFRSDLARILKAFPGAVHLHSADSIRAFSEGKIQLGVGHPASMGHGVDGLQNHCNIGVFFSSDWNLETRLQMIERIGPTRQTQAGKTAGVTWHSIVAKGTLDRTVLRRHQTKASVQDLLVAAMVKQEI